MPAVWWKDRKLLTGVVLVISSVILGLYGKLLFISKFYEPVYLITGLSIWAFSWILLLFGVFLVGWETVKLIQYRIHHHVKRTVKGTYDYTKEISKKGYHHTKKLHKIGMDRIAKTSKVIAEKIKP
jgi:hypothetical protein